MASNRSRIKLYGDGLRKSSYNLETWNHGPDLNHFITPDNCSPGGYEVQQIESRWMGAHVTTAESLISTGPDSGWLYVPCPIDVDGSPDDESEPHVVAVPRRQASVRFTYEQREEAHYWFVDAAEFRRLATSGE